MTSGYLLDTNVASASVPGKSDLDAKVERWLRETLTYGRVFVSVVSLAEIERGIRLLERHGPTRRSSALRQWLLDFETVHARNLLPVDPVTARMVGELDAMACLAGHEPELADVIVAATARIHDLTILTRNVRHFVPLGAPCHDPFS